MHRPVHYYLKNEEIETFTESGLSSYKRRLLERHKIWHKLYQLL